MNKLGIHICSYINSFTDDPTYAFPTLKACGIDNIEISILSEYSATRAKELLRKLQDNCLTSSCCTGLPENADLSSIEKKEVSNGVTYLKNCIDFCFNLGAHKLSGILYAPWGKIDYTRNKRGKWLSSIDSMREICDYAGKAGITLCIEVLNRFEGNFVNTINEGVEYLKIADKSNLKLLADTFHANIEEKDIVNSFVTNIHHIGNIHITEANRDFPQEINLLWPRLLTALKSAGYQGGFVFECCVRPDTEVGKAFFQWQDLLKGQNVFDKIRTSSYFINKFK